MGYITMGKTLMLIVAVLGSVVLAVPAVAQRGGGRLMTRATLSGQSKVQRVPRNRQQCLANRRALGFNIETQSAGRCDKTFPKKIPKRPKRAATGR